MEELEMYGGMDDHAPEPPPTKTIGESILAIAIALALGAGAVSLMLINPIAAFVGFFIWLAVTLGPGIAAAYYLDKHLMVGYHNEARLIVGGIILFSVATFVGVALIAYHF